MIRSLQRLLGSPVTLTELKNKPDRRRTLRAFGPGGTAIVKIYASGRESTVARRIGALGSGPPEPRVPAVLFVDRRLHMVVLSDVAGTPFRNALIEESEDACRHVGGALAAWHLFWRAHAPSALAPHDLSRELEILHSFTQMAPATVASAVRSALPLLGHATWEPTTVVHRDLYEEHILLGDGIGLIDIDDAALGPPELDLGNLWAHLELLALRVGGDFLPLATRLLESYVDAGGGLDPRLFAWCRSSTLLRLACIHEREDLVDAAMSQPLGSFLDMEHVFSPTRTFSPRGGL